MKIADTIIELYQSKGSGAYFGEGVTETEHALQSAHLAEKSGADQETIVAALLHDIGHLLHNLPEDIAEQGIDGRHEEGGAAWLLNYFPNSVVDPIRLHVAAKRYLCAVEEGYFEKLSPASQQSLRLQGGPFSREEIDEFEKEPFWRTALALRHWDDTAKLVGWSVPGLEHYRSHLQEVLDRQEKG
jgi:phosphonate degradation associated HDIG domain protein